MGRPRKERTEYMKCTGKCGETKHISEFGKKFICKDCNIIYVNQSVKKTEQEILGIIIAKKLMSESYVQKYREHIVHLHRSCKSRIRSCNAKEGYYTDVVNYWAKEGQKFGSFNMLVDIIENKRNMWEVWRVLYQQYIESNYDKKLKPEVDRILNDKNIGYVLPNIRSLTHADNWSLKNLNPSKILVKSVVTDKLIRQHLFTRLNEAAKGLKIDYGITKKEFEEAKNNQSKFVQINENFSLLYIPITEKELFESINNDPNLTYIY